MSAYIPGAGLRKPLNQMENPIYPDIKQGPPRFQNSGKHWVVDVGQTLKDTEDMPNINDHSVLYQSRDYNKTVYGQSSHKDVVNLEFRPPLIDQDDLLPLSRIPRKRVVPRINPKGPYEVQNNTPSEVEKHLTDKVKEGHYHPTFYCPRDAPIDNSILPDLESKLPKTSIGAGFNAPYLLGPPNNNLIPDLGPAKLPSVSGDAGFNPGMKYTPVNDYLPNIDLEPKRAYTSVSSGYNPSVKVEAFTLLEDLQLQEKNPRISAHSGNNNYFQKDNYYNGDLNLDYRNTPISVDSGRKLQFTDVTIQPDTNFETKINHNRVHHSYFVPPNSSIRDANVRTYKPDFSTRIQPKGSINSGGAIPRFGLDIPNFALREKKNMPSNKYHYSIGR